MTRVRVFIATSLDGFIAGPNDEIDWLSSGEGVEDTFSPFFLDIGSVLMGRRTFDVVSKLAGEWPYGDTPVLVATARPFDPPRPTARAITGSIEAIVAEAKAVAGERDVYLDGGALIRSALDVGLVDELAISVVPVVLGQGIPLLSGCTRRTDLDLISTTALGGGLVELRYHPRR